MDRKAEINWFFVILLSIFCILFVIASIYNLIGLNNVCVELGHDEKTGHKRNALSEYNEKLECDDEFRYEKVCVRTNETNKWDEPFYEYDCTWIPIVINIGGYENE